MAAKAKPKAFKMQLVSEHKRSVRYDTDDDSAPVSNVYVSKRYLGDDIPETVSVIVSL